MFINICKNESEAMKIVEEIDDLFITAFSYVFWDERSQSARDTISKLSEILFISGYKYKYLDPVSYYAGDRLWKVIKRNGGNKEVGDFTQAYKHKYVGDVTKVEEADTFKSVTTKGCGPHEFRFWRAS